MYWVDNPGDIAEYNHFDFFQKGYFDMKALKDLNQKSGF